MIKKASVGRVARYSYPMISIIRTLARYVYQRYNQRLDAMDPIVDDPLKLMHDQKQRCTICDELKSGHEFVYLSSCPHAECKACVIMHNVRTCKTCNVESDSMLEVKQEGSRYRIVRWSGFDLLTGTPDPLDTLYHSRRICLNCGLEKQECDFAYFSYCSHIFCKECSKDWSRCARCNKSLAIMSHVVKRGDVYRIEDWRPIPTDQIDNRDEDSFAKKLNDLQRQMFDVAQHWATLTSSVIAQTRQ